MAILESFPDSSYPSRETAFVELSSVLDRDQGKLWHNVVNLAHKFEVPTEQLTVATELTVQMNEFHPPTCSHCLRVAAMSVEVGDLLGTNPGKTLLAGLLHDVGKMDVNLETVKKTTKFTSAERREMSKHSSAGYYRILDYNALSTEELEELPRIIGTHHKRQLNNPYGMDDSSLSHEALKVRDAVTIADYIDRSFRNDGGISDTDPQTKMERTFDHIRYVLAQDTYDDISDRMWLANTIMTTALRARSKLIEQTN